MERLPALPDAGTGVAVAINESGQIAGSSGDQAVFWNHDHQVHGLGKPAGATLSYATAINESGVVVGSCFLESGGGHGLMWLPGEGPVDLNDLLEPQTLGTVTSATSINDAGQIVGWLQVSGVPNGRAVLLTPTPEPSAALLAAFGAAAWLAASTRRYPKYR